MSQEDNVSLSGIYIFGQTIALNPVRAKITQFTVISRFDDATLSDVVIFFYRFYLCIFFILMLPSALLQVTLIYFPFLLPLAMKENPEFAASPLDINIHGVNSIIMLLDNFFTAIPVRLLHVIYPIIYGAIYVIFSAIYFAFDPENHVVYPGLLDWRSPGVTIAVIVVVVGVLLPLIQLAWYGWYRLRLWTFRKFYHHDYCDPTML